MPPITRQDILDRVFLPSTQFRGMNVDPSQAMDAPSDNPNFVAETQAPPMSSGGGFASNHKGLLALLGGLAGAGIAGAVGGQDFRRGLVNQAQAIPGIFMHNQARREAQQERTTQAEANRKGMLDRLKLKTDADAQKQADALKSTPEGVFKAVTPEQATQNALEDIQAFMDDHPDASTQEKLAYHSQRSAQRDREIQTGVTKVAEPAKKEIIPVSSGYLDENRDFHQTAREPREPREPARQKVMGGDGLMHWTDTGELVLPGDVKKPAAVPAGIKVRLGGYDAATKGINSLLAQLKDADVQAGLGVVGGSRTAFSDWWSGGQSLSPAMKKFKTALMDMTGQLTTARYGARSSDQEQKIQKQIIGTIFTGPDALRTNLETVLEGATREQSALQDQVGAGPAGPSQAPPGETPQEFIARKLKERQGK